MRAGCFRRSLTVAGIRSCASSLSVKVRAVGEETFDWIGRWTPTPGTHWKGKVECFVGKQSRLRCTLLMHWEAGYEHPWAVLTDLSPEQAEVSLHADVD